MRKVFAALLGALLVCSFSVSASELAESVKKDYFDVLEIFAKKRMTQADADVYWRKLAIRTPSKDHASRPGTVHQGFNHAQPGVGHADSSFLLYKAFW